MIYTQNTELDNINKQRSKWMKQYSLEEYGKDWEYVVGLSYRSKMLHDSKCRKCWLKLYEERDTWRTAYPTVQCITIKKLINLP